MLLTGLYAAAESLCSIFVSVYLWVNSHDFSVVCKHYLALYIVVPFVFLLAGWYSQARDRLHVYRLGLVLHAVYYAALLVLRDRSPEYAWQLGALLGVTWGVFWAGANTFNFDVTLPGKRESYLGLIHALTGVFRLLGPLFGSLLIFYAPEALQGYHRVFAVAIVLFATCFVVSFLMPSDSSPRPFRIRRALFPGKDQRDWRLVMTAAMSLAGTFSIFGFLLGLVMYMQTGEELSVGVFASAQAIVGIFVSLVISRLVAPGNRKKFLRWGTMLLVVAGALISFKLTTTTLIVFGLMRAVAGPLFGIPHAGLRLDTIAKCAEEPAQRIEYLCAWEVPLAFGRIIMMLTMMGLYGWLSSNELGLRITLFILCAIRIVTYLILAQTSALRGERHGG